MTAAGSRDEQLRRGLRGLDDGSALLAERLGISREGAAEIVPAAGLSPDITEVSGHLPTASERIRAARQAQERPQLSSLDDGLAAPASDTRPGEIEI